MDVALCLRSRGARLNQGLPRQQRGMRSRDAAQSQVLEALPQRLAQEGDRLPAARSSRIPDNIISALADVLSSNSDTFRCGTVSHRTLKRRILYANAQVLPAHWTAFSSPLRHPKYTQSALLLSLPGGGHGPSCARHLIFPVSQTGARPGVPSWAHRMDPLLHMVLAST